MPAPLQILLISKATEQAMEFRDSLARVPQYEVKFEETAENAMALLSKGTLNCVIFNLATFGLSQVNLIRGICEATNTPQVLVFADTAEDGVMEAIMTDGKIIFVEKPLMNFMKDVAGLCHRLITGEDPKFRRESVRHAADQPVSVAILATGRHYDGRIRDMNDKGACLEINTTAIKIKDKVKVTMALDKLNRQRTFLAEVRWVKASLGRALVGIRFSKV